ncbi:aryl-alcohol oxidase precursor [Mycena sanguinolenta]|nr:aryl-alcohol oxidase precursor [Mycena sanguinolenta]
MVKLHLLLALALPLSCLAILYNNVAELPGTAFDFIVIGGGTAGNVVANRLTENPNFHVLVLEAGLTNEGALSSEVPFLVGTIPGSLYDWNYSTTAQSNLNERVIPYPRGFILGGSSAINYMVYSRGSLDDWNGFAEVTGDSGWSWTNVQQYFRKNERWSPPANNHSTVGEFDPRVHSTTGINSVSLSGFPQSIDPLLVKTTQELGGEFPFVLDINAGTPLGLGWLQSTIDSLGQRSTSATSYLGPKFINRPNLHVLVQAQVSRLIQTASNPPTFKSVEFMQGKATKLQRVSARNEIILSAGSIGSPHILLNSGIGDSKTLTDMGIKPLVHLPSVGQNLSDQMTVAIYWEVNATDTFDNITRNATLLDDLLEEWEVDHSGRFVTSILGNLLGWFRLPVDNPVLHGKPDPSSGPHSPHYEILPLNGLGPAAPPPTGHFISQVAAFLAPLSRGSVTLSSNNPFAAPLIDPGYLKNNQDLEMMRESIKLLQKFMSAPVWDDYLIGLFNQSTVLANASDAVIEEYVREQAATIFHPLGTSTMSAKGAKYGVVDPDLRVKGISDLRIVDGSVVPRPLGANPQAAVYVIGERASDLIKEAWGAH